MTSKRVTFLSIFIVTILVEYAVCASESDVYGAVVHRSRRQLLFPNSTLLQFNVGIGIPSVAKNVNVNFAFQANFQLPWNITQIPLDILHANSGYDGDARSRSESADYENDARTRRESTEYENDVSSRKELTVYEDDARSKRETAEYGNNARSRRESAVYEVEARSRRAMGDYENDAKLFHFYKYVEDVLNGFGHDGKACVRQALCQIGAEPLHSDDNEDLLHELATFVLNPLNDADANVSEKAESYPYIKALRQGQRAQNCLKLYAKCKMTFVDIFSKLHVMS